VRIRGAYRPDDLPATEGEVKQALTELRLPPGAASLWLSSAAGRLDTQAEWALDYDPELELATFEVRAGDRLVFGLDDWLPRLDGSAGR
jgi:hypothetical protein